MVASFYAVSLLISASILLVHPRVRRRVALS